MEFLQRINIFSKTELIAIGVIAIILLIMWFTGKKKEVKALAVTALHTLMLQLEQYLGSGKGKEKLEEVLKKYDEFLKKLPFFTRTLLKIFISSDKVLEIIEDLVPKINKLFVKDTSFEDFKNNILEVITSEIAYKIKKDIEEKALKITMPSSIESVASDVKSIIINRDEFMDIQPNLVMLPDDTKLLNLYAKLQSDFKEKTVGELGINFQKKFK